jgi:ABC-2 type transport system permease protein
MNAVVQVTLREWRWIRRDFRQILLVVLAPLAFVTILSLGYSSKKVVGVPVLIVDQDHSALSRKLTQAIFANESFAAAEYADSSDEFATLVAQDRAHVCFVFPHNMERDMLARRGSKAVVMVDASNLLAASLEASNAVSVLGTFALGAEMRMIEAKAGVTRESAFNRALPIQTGFRSWFNPGFTANYFNFMVIGILSIPVQLAGLLVGIGSGASEYKARRSDPLTLTTRSPWAILFGKLLAYLAIAYPVILFVVCFPHLFFGAPMAGSLLTLALVTLWFTSVLVVFGYALSSLIADPLFATEICAIITLPNFLLSGFTWPAFSMPIVVRILAYALPMHSFNFMFRKISVMGASAQDCLLEMGLLSLWTILALVLARVATKNILDALSRDEESANA